MKFWPIRWYELRIVCSALIPYKLKIALYRTLVSGGIFFPYLRSENDMEYTKLVSHSGCSFFWFVRWGKTSGFQWADDRCWYEDGATPKSVLWLLHIPLVESFWGAKLETCIECRKKVQLLSGYTAQTMLGIQKGIERFICSMREFG